MRILAGRFKGKRLAAPAGQATRPTAERLRQALFDMLSHAPWSPDWDGLHVLDAFAGTGALGLEAASRGAAWAGFVERDPAALAALRANVAACGAEARVMAADVLRPPPGRPCGLVFLDPPYGAGLLAPAVTALRRAGWVDDAAVLVAEAPADEAVSLGTLLAERTHGAGRVTVWRAGPG